MAHRLDIAAASTGLMARGERVRVSKAALMGMMIITTASAGRMRAS